MPNIAHVDNFLDNIEIYYSKKITAYGTQATGVDWNSTEGQKTRFSQLCKIIANDHLRFSINDVGCGYGALVEFLTKNYPAFSYYGNDICKEMISAANDLHKCRNNVFFSQSEFSLNRCDYSIASGVFNVRLDKSDQEWLSYIIRTLDQMFSNSNLGFSFNCLTKNCDASKKRKYLYYAEPRQMLEICKQRYSNQLTILQNYGLYEFTILVGKKL